MFGLILITFLLVGISSAVIRLILSPLPGFLDNWLGSLVAHSLTVPFAAATLTTAYFQLTRTATEHVPRARRADALTRGRAYASRVTLDRETEERIEEPIPEEARRETRLTPSQAVEQMRINVPVRGNRKLRTLIERVNADRQLKAWWHAANVNAVVRMEINDHSWVHIQIVTNIALKLLRQLTKHGIEPSLVRDYGMSSDDAEVVVVLGALLHCVGMAVHREGHEDFSLFLAEPKMRALLDGIYEEPDLTIITSEVLQAITSHREYGKPLTIEAGIVRVADALDMAKGRSRIPFERGSRLDPLALGGGDRRRRDQGRRAAADPDRDRHEQLVGHLPGRRAAEGEAARLGTRAVRRGRRAHRHGGGEAARPDVPARDLAE